MRKGINDEDGRVSLDDVARNSRDGCDVVTKSSFLSIIVPEPLLAAYVNSSKSVVLQKCYFQQLP